MAPSMGCCSLLMMQHFVPTFTHKLKTMKHPQLYYTPNNIPISSAQASMTAKLKAPTATPHTKRPHYYHECMF